MKRFVVFSFGVLSYVMFFVSICYAMGFVAGVLVPKHLGTGPAAPVAEALIVNSLLLAAFAVQHTIMARPAFKEWITRYVPKSVERSIFVFMASGILLVTFWQWRPLPGVLWQVDNPAIAAVLAAGTWLGFAIVFLSSFLINHFDLFGLRQVWLYLVDKTYTNPAFRLTGLYKYVRHPLMLGFLIAVWSAPVMTAGHLLFSVLVTGYIFAGIQFEERDLERMHGEVYRQYRDSVPMILPYKGKGPVRLLEDMARRTPIKQTPAH